LDRRPQDETVIITVLTDQLPVIGIFIPEIEPAGNLVGVLLEIAKVDARDLLVEGNGAVGFLVLAVDVEDKLGPLPEPVGRQEIEGQTVIIPVSGRLGIILFMLVPGLEQQ
jgi:hypothetical protein